MSRKWTEFLIFDINHKWLKTAEIIWASIHDLIANNM